MVLHEQFNGHPVAKVVKQKFSKLRETDQELLHTFTLKEPVMKAL